MLELPLHTNFKFDLINEVAFDDLLLSHCLQSVNLLSALSSHPLHDPKGTLAEALLRPIQKLQILEIHIIHLTVRDIVLQRGHAVAWLHDGERPSSPDVVGMAKSRVDAQRDKA